MILYVIYASSEVFVQLLSSNILVQYLIYKVSKMFICMLKKIKMILKKTINSKIS